MSQNKSIEELLLYGKNYLKQLNDSTAVLDAEVLLMHTLNFSKIELFLRNKEMTTDTEQNNYLKFIKQRALGTPIQYITKNQEFMCLDFNVDSSTLIPRADTEILVETILNTSKINNIEYIMDIGTGTGCIPISLLYYLKNIKAVAVDISSEALKIAENNAYKNNVQNRITFIQSNLFNDISYDFIGKLDAIVSNPPYIPSNDIPKLMKGVRDYEPIIALDGGTDGLDFYRIITHYGQKYIRNGGFLFYEIGYNQSEAVSNIMKQQGIENIKIIKDLAGLDRVIIGNRKC